MTEGSFQRAGLIIVGYCFGILVSEGRLSCYKYVCGIFRWFQVNLGSEDLRGKNPIYRNILYLMRIFCKHLLRRSLKADIIYDFVGFYISVIKIFENLEV